MCKPYHENTSFWYFLEKTFKMKHRVAKRKESRLNRKHRIRVKRMFDQHNYYSKISFCIDNSLDSNMVHVFLF